MATRVEAVYEDGVPHPMEPLALAEHEHVTITIEQLDDLDDLIDHEYLAKSRADSAARNDRPVPTIKEIRERLEKVRGSLSDLIIQERGER